MDEDYLADAEAPFSWRSEAGAGYGALDDFAVHPLSLISTLIGRPSAVFGEMSKPYPDRPDGGGRRAVETFDIATALLRMEDGASGTIHVNRCAWGRKGRLQLQLFGVRGAITFDQERFNEVGLYVAEGPAELNVRYVLEGSVQRGGNRMRVNAQLIDAASGNHLWAERFDKPLADLFDMQDEIVARLANALDAQFVAA